jgi:hypothetical protein
MSEDYDQKSCKAFEEGGEKLREYFAYFLGIPFKKKRT